jgi:hypothetical protein
MFIQVIEGHADDPRAFERLLGRWDTEVRPGADGYLGTTGGCTPDGDCVLVARFSDRDAAKRNGQRAEQQAWWRDLEQCLGDTLRHHETTEVHVMESGDLDRAGFVQVMEGHVSDCQRAIAMEEESEADMRAMRPDLLGAVTAYFDNDDFTSIAYFTSEQEARAGESKDMPADMAEKYESWSTLMKVDRYLDVPRPHLTSA